MNTATPPLLRPRRALSKAPFGEPLSRYRGRVPHPNALEAIYASLFGLPGVFGTFVGFKTKGGKRQSHLSVVCCVERKRTRGRLRASEAVPRLLEWTRAGSRQLIRTDVLEMDAALDPLSLPVAGPGDEIRPGPSAFATAGVVVESPGGERFLTTAGHAFRTASTAEVRSDGVVFRATRAGVPVIDATSDYVLLRVDPPSLANLFLDESPIQGPYYPTNESDLGLPLYALTRRGAVGPLHCHGIKGQFRFPNGAVLADLILTEKAPLAGGDSGSVLVDDAFRAWGLLRGAHPTQNLAFFHPVFSLLKRENASLS